MPIVSTMEIACGQCSFFDTKAAASGDTGLCRFNPPTAQGDKAVWPVVSKSDWCAHFEPEEVDAE